MSRAIPLHGVPEPCDWGCCPGGMPVIATRKERRWARRYAAKQARRCLRREQRR